MDKLWLSLAKLKLKMKLLLKLGIEVGDQLLFWVAGDLDGWSLKSKVILNSTQFKLKLKLELSLAKGILYPS